MNHLNMDIVFVRPLKIESCS